MMKALLLTREFPPEVYGGAGMHVAYLARELARRIPVEVRTFGRQAVTEHDLRVVGQGARLDAFPGPFGPALETVRVAAALAAPPLEADVVHAHTWYAALGGFLVRTLYGIPLVCTAHSLEPLRPWKREQLGRGAELAAWLERTALEAADAVIAVSGEMRDDILRHFAVAPEKVVVIGNGVDTDEFRRTDERDALRRHGIDDPAPYVLFVGRISRQKGILHLLQAVARLDPAVQLVLCASSPDTPEVAEELAAAVAAARAAGRRVHWIRAMVPQAELAQLYSHAALFCCPSVYEPFGIINLEAMACATPVVASAVGGIPDVVVDQVTGLLVPVALRPDATVHEAAEPAAFADALAAAMGSLLADPARAQVLGLAGRERAVRRFSWRAVAAEVLALYESLGRPAAAAGGRHAA